MLHETEVRTNPQLRADRFVTRWQQLERANDHHNSQGDYSAYRSTNSTMADMAKGLERDLQLESILANRKLELGISFDRGRSLGEELAFAHGFDLGRKRGLGI
jgi:hypothetical protein